jgi:ABC-type maltose transport system permease subunit
MTTVAQVRNYTLDPAQKRAIRRRKLRRAGVYVLAVTISLWILIPIWLIGTMAFITRADVRGYPKQVAPVPFSTETMRFFLDAEGILDATRNSIIVALATLALSTIIAAPTGYAISRYVFPAGCVPAGIWRCAPGGNYAVPLAVQFRDWGVFDKIYTLALMHGAHVADNDPRDRERVCQRPARTRRGCEGFRVQSNAGVLENRDAIGSARNCGLSDLHVCDVME